MADHLAAARKRLSEIAEAYLSDHVGIMASVLVDEALSKVEVAQPATEQRMVSEFLSHIGRALPPELDSNQMMKSLFVLYLQK